MAAVSHGSSYLTRDLDICYDRSGDNLAGLSRALRPLHPELRDAPEATHFELDERALALGMNFTLNTDVGEIDLFGEVKGVGGYALLAPRAVQLEVFGRAVLVMGLEDLVRSKEATGRTKDKLLLAELQELLRRKG